MVLTNTSLRLPQELIDRLDAYAAQLQEVDDLGRRITRSDAARILLLRGLEKAGVPKAKPAKAKAAAKRPAKRRSDARRK